MKSVITEIGDILDTYCQPCTITYGMDSTQQTRTCKHCQVGKALSQIGMYLGDIKEVVPFVKRDKNFTKEEYLHFKELGNRDKDVVRVMKISNETLQRMKREWGIVERRGPKSNQNVG